MGVYTGSAGLWPFGTLASEVISCLGYVSGPAPEQSTFKSYCGKALEVDKLKCGALVALNESQWRKRF